MPYWRLCGCTVLLVIYERGVGMKLFLNPKNALVTLPPKKRLIVAAPLILLGIVGYFALNRWVWMGSLPEGLIQANGRIEGDHVTVASKFSGRIQKLLAREGDMVAMRQVLVQLDDSQIRAKVKQAREAVAVCEAQLQAARTALDVLRKEVPLAVEAAQAGVTHARAVVAKTEATERQTRRDAARLRELATSGTVDKHRSEQADLAWTVARNELESARTALIQSQKQLDQAKLGWDRIKAKEDDIRALEAQRDQARAALAESESVLADLTIVAPISGIIMTRVRDVGEVVVSGSPLFDIVDLDQLYLKVYVPETQIGKLRLGLPARVYVDAFPDQPFAATVRYISSRAEFTPKEVQTPDERVKLVYAVKLYLDKNPDHRLTPGMPADAVIRWKGGTTWAKPRW